MRKEKALSLTIDIAQQFTSPDTSHTSNHYVRECRENLLITDNQSKNLTFKLLSSYQSSYADSLDAKIEGQFSAIKSVSLTP